VVKKQKLLDTRSAEGRCNEATAKEQGVEEKKKRKIQTTKVIRGEKEKKLFPLGPIRRMRRSCCCNWERKEGEVGSILHRAAQTVQQEEKRGDSPA